jgi:adenine-specific DNA-methyltransferase
MTKKQKLELTWIGKDNRPRLEPRILLEDPSLSHHAAHRVAPNDLFDNRLIFGDNLLALKAMEQEFTGKIKCIFIDPPYNTGSAFTHYDDGIEHSLWLSLMRDRLDILRRLLSPDGSLWVTVDDNEAHYLKVLLDEVFGRDAFVANVVWQKAYSARMDAKEFSYSHDHLLVYKRSDLFTVRKLRVDQDTSQFSFVDAATGRHYRRRSLRKEGSSSKREDRPNLWYALKAPDGTRVFPVKPSGIEGYWRWSPDTYAKNEKLGLVEWVNTVRGWDVYVRQFLDDEATRPPDTWWTFEEAGHNHEAKEEARALNPGDTFDTPKPERLLQRVLSIGSDPGDIVLDSFAGSGTTGAVAHKMGRRWIMVELGEHCQTHIIPRLKKVIDGEDTGGITNAVGWKGGGGFRYFRLAPSLLRKDQWGNLVVNKEYNAAMLAEAMCKLEGFTYAPSETDYWQHGSSTERDFIYVTTQKLTREQLAVLSEEVGDDRSLLVCCAAFRTKPDAFPNLTIKKIPNAVLARCEWGHDDYSLQIKNLPAAPDLLPEDELPPGRRKTKGKAAPASMPLFDTGDDR